MSRPRYAFRDTDLARTRLELVGQVFEPPSAAFLQTQVDHPPRLALDLGCGPGTTTRLVARLTGAKTAVGLDTSEPFLQAAKASASPNTFFALHDVGGTDFPTRAPDLIYARLLLAHLPNPASVASRWANQLAPGGQLLLDEVEYIRTANPVLAFYERVVVGLVGTRGGPMYAGPLVSDLKNNGLRKTTDAVVEHAVSTADAARMYGMNLQTWRDDPYVTTTYSTQQIDDLATGLDALTTSTRSGEIEWGLRQVAYRTNE
jgi:SAM-dependent methyltransferase